MFARRKVLLPVVLILTLACAAYLPTVMPDISASPHPYFTDVGNVQNALNLWGTLHSSGYPFFSLAGALFVFIVRSLGVVPAAAAGLFSTLWAIATLVVFYLLIVAWRNDRAVALIAAALLGAGWAYWLFASYAEVYSLVYFVVAVALYAAVKADQTGRVRWLYILAACAGMSVAHHRVIALTAPALLLIAGPALWREVRRHPWFVAKAIGLAVLIGVLPYAYIWLRAQQPGAWIWGDPATLPGLWRQMLGETYLRMFVWPTSPAEWGTILQSVMKVWFETQAWPAMLLGALGIAWMLARRQFRYALAFLLGAVVPFVIAVADRTFFGTRRLPEDIPALLVLTSIFMLLALAYVLSDLPRISPWPRRLALLICGALSVMLVVQNQPSVYAVTHDNTGRRIITAAQQFVAEHPSSTPPAFFAPWGGEYWALAYASSVTGELKNYNLLPNRADLRQELNRQGVIYVFSDTLYNYDLNWWRKQLGPIHLSGSGAGTIAISAQPPITEQTLPHPDRAAAAMGEAPLALRDWQVKPLGDGRWQMTLYWQATAQPDRDYSVSVKATNREVIASPADIVAQADSNAPVHGWYPTTLWSPGEIVRDDYVIAPPADKPAKIVEVGLYTQDSAGNFQNYGRQVIPLQ